MRKERLEVSEELNYCEPRVKINYLSSTIAFQEHAFCLTLETKRPVPSCNFSTLHSKLSRIALMPLMSWLSFQKQNYS